MFSLLFVLFLAVSMVIGAAFPEWAEEKSLVCLKQVKGDWTRMGVRIAFFPVRMVALMARVLSAKEDLEKEEE